MPNPHPYLDHPGPIAFAHRGGATAAPENTMLAFEDAVSLGYRYVETDVQATSDGVLLAFHDDDLSRTCNVEGRISQMTHREVASCRVDGREPIPLLEDILGTWPDLRVNIDCKSWAALEPLVRVLVEHDALERVCLGSFSDARLGRLRERLGPRACTSMGPREVARLLAASRMPFIGPPPGQAAQVPLSQGRIPVVTRRLVERAQMWGLAVHVWTIDDPDEMHRLLDLGVDGIMTDDTRALREVMQVRGAW